MNQENIFDVVVVGGGPSGATAATQLARGGRKVARLDRAGRVKPCGGAVPPILINEFQIPDDLIVAKVKSARMVSPKGEQVDMPIDGGYIGMVDREHFDEWLRARAALVGAARFTGAYDHITRADGVVTVHYSQRNADGIDESRTLQTRQVIGADGPLSQVARQEIKGAERICGCGHRISPCNHVRHAHQMPAKRLRHNHSITQPLEAARQIERLGQAPQRNEHRAAHAGREWPARSLT